MIKLKNQKNNIFSRSNESFCFIYIITKLSLKETASITATFSGKCFHTVKNMLLTKQQFSRDH